MDSVTEENVERLKKEHQEKSDELQEVSLKSIETMWSQDLDKLEKEYVKYRDERERSVNETKPKTKPIQKTKKTKLVIKEN
jgi:hypothetical protein